jgi:hypothetical protein
MIPDIDDLRQLARALRDLHRTGAVAFSRAGDPGSGEFADAVMLKAFGKVPNDFGLR